MNWPTAHRVLRVGRTRCRLLLPLVVVGAMLMALTTPAQPAHADTTGTTNPGCMEVLGASFSPGCLPPDLLTLSGIYAASSAQASSLQAIQNQAVNNVIAAHSLSPNDGDAVLSWGRSDAEADLFTLLMQAVTTSAASRSTDQQNAVDWLTAVAQRQTVAAAQDAGLEYVKWAGLNEGAYQSLLNTNPSENTIQAFLSTPGYPTSLSPFTNQSDSGYCVYQSPAPYASDYADPTSDPTCNGQTPPLGYVPPTPSYAQFTKWGEADANYTLLATGGYLTAAAADGIGGAFGYVAGALVSGLAVGSQGATNLAREAWLNNVDSAEITPTPSSPSGYVANLSNTDAEAELSDVADAADAADAFDVAGAGLGLFTFLTVLAAIEAAVIEGINVFTAAALPGQLATLISSAEATPPDVASLESTSSGQATLYELLVGATLPTPTDQTCDNSSPIPPGVTVTSGPVPLTGSFTPCLNPTLIPSASATDPQFVVQEKGSTTSSTTSSITWQDAAAGATTTARLSGNWFILNGSTQTLSFTYTDWDGNEQVAWLVGSPSAGYQFIGYNLTAGNGQQVDPSTCFTGGVCWTSTTIDYVGSDGDDDRAYVQSPVTPAGTETGDNPTGVVGVGKAVEGAPVQFDPTTFGPADDFDSEGQLVGTATMSYTWQFEVPTCTLGCLHVNGAPPQFTSPVTSTGDYSYTFPTSGSYLVELTATDGSTGEHASYTFAVQVDDVPPTLALDPDCPAAQCDARTVPVGTTTDLAGTLTHAGAQDIENVYVDWGDGASVDSAFCGLVALPGGGDCNPGSAVPGAIDGLFNPTALTLTAASDTDIALTDQHTYASAGTYYATVTVTDQSGAKVSGTLVETVTNPAPTTTGLSPTSTPVGSSPTITVSGFGFVPGSTVEWDGSPLTTTYVAPPTTVSIAPRTLTAQLPATDTAGATVGTVTVVNAAPGGGTSSPQFLYVVPAQVAIAAANVATSTSATGNATASVGGTGAGKAGSLSGVASGAGTVAVAQFSADPVTTTPPTAVNAYFNVVVPTGSSFTSVQVTDCDLAGGSVVYYYDPTTTQWAEVPGQTYNASTGCVSFTLGTASTPSLSQLSSTVFGVQDVPPSLSLPGDQSVSYHAALSLSVSASDPQPNALTLSATGLPAGLAFTDNGNGTGTVTGTVTGAPGAYPVTLTASDGEVSTTSPMTITVTKAGTTLSYTGASLIATNRPATLSATLEEDGGSAPVPDGQTVTLTLGSGSGAAELPGPDNVRWLGELPDRHGQPGPGQPARLRHLCRRPLLRRLLRHQPAGPGVQLPARRGRLRRGRPGRAQRHAHHDAHLVGQQVGQVEPALGRGGAGQLQGLRPDVPQRAHHRRRPGLRRDLDGDH